MSSYIGLSQNSKDVLQVTIIMTSHPPAKFKGLSHQQCQLTNWQWLFFSYSHGQINGKVSYRFSLKKDFSIQTFGFLLSPLPNTSQQKM